MNTNVSYTVGEMLGRVIVLHTSVYKRRRCWWMMIT